MVIWDLKLLLKIVNEKMDFQNKVRVSKIHKYINLSTFTIRRNAIYFQKYNARAPYGTVHYLLSRWPPLQFPIIFISKFSVLRDDFFVWTFMTVANFCVGFFMWILINEPHIKRHTTRTCHKSTEFASYNIDFAKTF